MKISELIDSLTEALALVGDADVLCAHGFGRKTSKQGAVVISTIGYEPEYGFGLFVHGGVSSRELAARTQRWRCGVGADLVGQMCEYSNDLIHWNMFGAYICDEYNPEDSYPFRTHNRTACAKYARLANTSPATSQACN